MPSTRQLLQRLPFGARTGIGSLPHTAPEPALRISFEHEIPFLPELPALGQTQRMLPSALEGLPGLRPDGQIEVDGWRPRADRFTAALEQALSSGDLSAFEPVGQACFRPFLSELQRHKPQLAKVQIAGPITVQTFAKTSDAEPTSQIAKLDHQVGRLLLARSLALVHAVQRTGATPILFVDEPGLSYIDFGNPGQRAALEALKQLISAVQMAGALVGVHCCGNTDWAALLGLGADIVSIDARLSLDALLEQTTAWRAFLDSGATLALGVIPTDAQAVYAVAELVDAIEVSVRATTPNADAVLGRMIFTPACGLGAHTVPDAERIVRELGMARQRVLALVPRLR